ARPALSRRRPRSIATTEETVASRPAFRKLDMMSTRQFASSLLVLRDLRRPLAGLWVATATLAIPSVARASLLSPELEDKVAWGIAIFVLFVVPITLIALFWMVHVLPEKIAHKRHHPQFEAIR